ncbi:protein of unknown function [Pararobbsia alpina]
MRGREEFVALRCKEGGSGREEPRQRVDSAHIAVCNGQEISRGIQLRSGLDVAVDNTRHKKRWFDSKIWWCS